MPRGCRSVHAAREYVSLHRKRYAGDQADRTQRYERYAPAERAADTETHDRGERIAHAAADAVRAVRVAETLRRHVRVEHGEVRGMKHAVADAHQNGQRKQPVHAGHEAIQQYASREQAEPAQQHRPGAEAVHGETGAKLAYPAR